MHDVCTSWTQHTGVRRDICVRTPWVSTTSVLESFSSNSACEKMSSTALPASCARAGARFCQCCRRQATLAQQQSCIWPHSMLTCSCNTPHLNTQGRAPAAATQSGQVSGFAPAPAPLAHSWRCRCAVHRRLARPETAGLRAAQLRSWQIPGLHDVLGASPLEVDYHDQSRVRPVACTPTNVYLQVTEQHVLGSAWHGSMTVQAARSPEVAQCQHAFPGAHRHHDAVHGTTS
jgi:hypothetical protein